MHCLSHGARLVWRADRGTPGKPGFRAGSWVIREGRKERRLGLDRDQRHEADRRLAAYIGIRDATEPTHEARSPERLRIADVLACYGEEHAPTVGDPARICTTTPTTSPASSTPSTGAALRAHPCTPDGTIRMPAPHRSLGEPTSRGADPSARIEQPENKTLVTP